MSHVPGRYIPEKANRAVWRSMAVLELYNKNVWFDRLPYISVISDRYIKT